MVYIHVYVQFSWLHVHIGMVVGDTITVFEMGEITCIIEEHNIITIQVLGFLSIGSEKIRTISISAVIYSLVASDFS